HVQLGGNLLVGAALGGELGDSPLRLRQFVGGRPATADPPQLRAGFVGPQPRAQLLEDGERLLERLPSCALLLRLPADHAETEQRAAALERVRRCIVPGALERRERSFQVALHSCEQAAAAGRTGPSPWASEAGGVGLVRREEGGSLLELAEGDERLDRVCPDRECWVVHSACQ